MKEERVHIFIMYHTRYGISVDLCRVIRPLSASGCVQAGDTFNILLLNIQQSIKYI